MRLGELVSKNLLCLKNGFSQREHNQVGAGVPHLRPFNIGDSGEITLSQVKYIPVPAENAATWVSRGAIVFNNTNSEELVGKTAYFNLDGRFLVSNHMTVIRVCSPQIDAYWLSRYLHWLWRQRVFLRFCRRHVNQASVSLARLKQVPVCLPPLHEQRAIAHVLETVQAAKEATERVVGALRELKKSLMQHLFTYGPVPVGSQHAVPLRDTENASAPDHWRALTLRELAENGVLWIKNGFSEGKHKRAGSGVPHLRPFNITDGGDVSLSQVKYICPPANSSVCWLLPGDVVFNNTNSERLVGKTAYFNLDGKFLISNHMTMIRVCSDQMDSYWLSRYLYWLWSRRLFQGLCRRHVNQASVSLERLKEVTIPLPPLSEQREIARILQAVDRRIQAEEAYARALGELFKTLLRELMTGRIRVTNHAAEEDHDPKG